MKPFQFRFATVLEWRCQQRDEAGADVGKATEAIGRVDEQVRDIDEQLQTLRRRAGESMLGDSLTVDRMLHHGRFDLQLQAERNALQQTREKLEAELERRRQLLVAAEAEVKRLERLRDRQASQHAVEAQRQAQAEADDLTAARFLIARRRESIKRSMREPSTRDSSP